MARLLVLLILTQATLTTTVLAVDNGDAAPQPLALDPVVVVASKTARPLSDVLGQVSVIDAAFIERFAVENMDDLLRYEPGINLESSGTRFGANAVNIRGIGGNRVAIEVDGVPVRDRFAIGNFSDGGRIQTETDRIKRLEVLYGPASTLYGSDALGGVMAITTFDPDDLLKRGDGRHWYSLRGAYQGVNNSLTGSGIASWGNENNGLMFAATWRDGQETDNQASDGTTTDQQDWDSHNYFVRVTHDTANGNRLRFSVDDYQKNANINIESLPGNGRFRSTTMLSGDDEDEHQQLSLEYEFNTTWTNGVLRVFNVDSTTRQLTHEERAAASKPIKLQRYFQYEQEFSGVELNLFRDLSLGRSQHHIGVGLEYQSTDSSEFRDGFQQSLVDGFITKSVLGENLPVRDFPNSRTRELGGFLQDEISLGGGRWELVPALRYDRYELDPKPDSLYLEDNPQTSVVSVDEYKFSPRLGMLYHVNAELGLYLQFVKGFRAPPFEDANIGLDIPLFNIRAIPNPDLKSETSAGVEAGLRVISENTRLTVSLFDTLYDDFIETKARVGSDPESGVLLFQSRNINRTRIYGVDIRLEQHLAAWSQSLENWRLNAAAYWSRGENRDNQQPLNSVSPPQMILGVSWTSASERLDANLTATYTSSQDRIDETSGPHLPTPSWTTADLTAGWQANEHFSLRVGIFNLTDERYWRWSDVSLFRPDNPMLELLTRPGRHYSVSARMQW